jgi:hypothetical protein
MATPYDEWKTTPPEDLDIPEEFFEQAKIALADDIYEKAFDLYQAKLAQEATDQAEDAAERRSWDRQAGIW